MSRSSPRSSQIPGISPVTRSGSTGSLTGTGPVFPPSPPLPSSSSSSSSSTGDDHVLNASVEVPSLNSILEEQSKLVPNFITFCSYLFADCNESGGQVLCRLCFLILLIMVENTEIEDAIHDSNTNTTLLIYNKKSGATLRESSTIATSSSSTSSSGNTAPLTSSKGAHTASSQGMARIVLDVLNSFMKQNLVKKTNYELYTLCVTVVHRILSYEKKTATRLSFKWKEIWTTLFLVIREAMPSHSPSSDDATQGGGAKQEALPLCMSVITIFNLFITYGDTFLPSPSDYDDLIMNLCVSVR
eukprot:TRINITY_DN5145_c0_g1_i1.p2 TRINITY_DN5145_c0_g1~~TRINITY_DN5145_c0_g1_i1.p2  ORF type:complete len:301 (+),score=93.07 TRINITY_DN5145_c0_g1_i1:1058-1960(+)